MNFSRLYLGVFSILVISSAHNKWLKIYCLTTIYLLRLPQLAKVLIYLDVQYFNDRAIKLMEDFIIIV